MLERSLEPVRMQTGGWIGAREARLIDLNRGLTIES